MKIAVWYNLPSGGGKRALYSHVQGLLQRGHEVKIFCPQTANRSYLPLDTLAEEHVTPLEQLPDYGANFLSHARLTIQRVPWEIKRMEHTCKCAAIHMREGQFDILFANACQSFFAPAIGRMAATPCVLYLQEPDRHSYEAMPRLPWIGRERTDQTFLSRFSPTELVATARDLADLRKVRLRAQYEQRNARAYDAILVNSLFSRESILRAYGLESQVCYLGVDTTRFVCHSPHSPREDFVIGVGALQPQKNIEFVIRALGMLPSPRPRLVWVGNVADGNYLHFLEGLAKAQGVCFETHVMVSDDTLVDLLNRAAMMVYAPRLEPFGYAPLEANACGLPVVGVAEGGVRETIQDSVNGLLVEGSLAAMAQAIQRLWDNPGFARQLGQKGLERVQTQWSLEAATDRLESWLADIARTCTARTTSTFSTNGRPPELNA